MKVPVPLKRFVDDNVKVCVTRDGSGVDCANVAAKPEALGVDIEPRQRTLKVSGSPKRGGDIQMPDVATLFDGLNNEATEL